MLKQIILFFLLVLGAVYVNYFSSDIVSGLYFAGTLIAYYRSEDEGFWLPFFLIVSDGFFGFFGLYEAVLQILPGLPPIEIGQIYIGLTIVKATNKKQTYRPFFNTALFAMFVYLMFLVVQGHAVGLSTAMNVQFRVFKEIFPLFLLYSLPRLFTKIEQIRDIFAYLFPVAFVILATQLFTMILSQTPPQFFGVKQEAWFAIELTADKTYRGFYNDNVILLTTFGALYFLALKKEFFSSFYLTAILLANFSSIYLSATRGWTISITFIILLAVIFVFQLNIRRLAMMAALVGVLLFSAQQVPIVAHQINNAMDRMFTLTKLAQGDLSAGGTLIRINFRGPRVLRKWKESKLTGLGFSNAFFDSSDLHVGNHNILLHAGIIGAVLMASFFIYFLLKIFLAYLSLPATAPLKGPLLVLIIFFLGLFIVHSSSEQILSYYQPTAPGIMLGVYFCMAALTYYLAMNKQIAKTEKEEEPKHQSKIIPIRENLSPNGESKHIIGAKEKYLGGYRNKNNAFLDLMDLRKLDQKGLSDSLENDGI